MSAVPTNQPLPAWRRVMELVRIVFTPLSLLVIFWLVHATRDSFTPILATARWPLVLAAAVLWLMGNGLAALTTSRLLKSVDIDIGAGTCLSIHCRRLPAKYLPGGIWHSVGRVSDYLSLGHAPRALGRYFLLENLALVGTTLSLGAVLTASLLPDGPLRLAATWLPLAGAAGLLGLPWLLRIAGRHAQLTQPQAYLQALPAMLGFWILAGGAFTLWLAAFPGLGLAADAVQTAGVYILSWSIGYLAVFAPQGIGVAELVSGYLLAGADAVRILGLLASFRLLVLVVDLVAWALALLCRSTP